MLKTLNNWWSQDGGSHEEPELELAITKLMVGMMAMDGHKGEDEYNEVMRLLGAHYDLTDEESELLIDQAMDKERSDLRFSKVVAQISKSFSVDERANILRKVWQIAISDGDINFLEEQYINRLSGLIGVPATLLNELKGEEERLYPNLNHSKRYQDPAQI